MKKSKVQQPKGKAMKQTPMKQTTTNHNELRWSRRAQAVTGWLALLASGSFIMTTAQAATRPISDFLSRQGQWSLHLDADGNPDCAASAYDGGVSGFLFEPPLQNFVDWTEPQNNTSASFDYAGLLNVAAGGALGTTTSGSINEVVHQDGTVTDTIILSTTHALAWATTGIDSYGTGLFGHTAIDVIFHGATPSFGNCTLKLVINGPAANQPLPDFEEMFIGCSSWSFVSVDFIGSAFGALPDGTPARMQVAQVGLLATAGKANSKSRVARDAFPTEHIVISTTAPH
jgi:hypothetical protein